MRSFLTASRLALFAVGTALLTGASTATAADVFLKAQTHTHQTDDLTDVPMWVYVSCPDNTYTSCDAPDVGGPQIDLTDADTLTINIQNDLVVPVSVHIPGLGAQGGAGAPEFDTDGKGRARVRSFTTEVAAGGTGSYTYSTLTPGTYLYQSGTYPSIQVPMGLYGALVVTPATSATCASGTSAYDDADSCFDTDRVLLFSELDPWLNDAIDAAGATVADYPSTVDYLPSYLLVNGEEALDMAAAGQDDVVLLRMLNAGLTSHKPQVVGIDMGLIAEDGFRYPGDTVREQASVLVAAGKTMDVLLDTPADDVTFGLFDRLSRSDYGHQGAGGLIASLDVGGGAAENTNPLLAADDAYFADEDVTSLALGNVLANDTINGLPLSGSATSVLSRDAANGTVTWHGDGTFDYAPSPNFAGTDTFMYTVTDGGSTASARVTIAVAFMNDLPVANDDGPYVNQFGSALFVDAAHGVLGNDYDPDGDAIIALVATTTAHGILALNPYDGSFTYMPTVAVTTPVVDSFTYFVLDDSPGFNLSNTATVTLQVNPQANVALTVEDENGVQITDYRWVIQEDRTFHHNPAEPAPASETLSTNLHKSHMPVVATGSGAAEFATVALDPSNRYYVSVLPADAGLAGHTLGGGQLLPGMTAMTVLTRTQPIGSAQISIHVFEDLSPTNGVPDPGEPALGGWQVLLEDAGGRYGVSGGQMLQDAFGEPLKNSLDCFGGVAQPAGVILTCPDGNVLIKDIAPGKYGVVVIPPAGIEGTWTQTSTIEGSPVVDAWVKANEPPFFVEFGGAQTHAFFGFVNPAKTVPPIAGSNTITGRVTLLHDPRPPGPVNTLDSDSWAAMGHTTPWVGLNTLGGDGPNIRTVQADVDDDGNATFTLEGIPDGVYQLVVWDEFLDVIIDFTSVDVSGGGVTDMGNIPVNAWFTRIENNVFQDDNENGIWDDGELPLAEQAVLLRWRDGTVYQEFPTDLEGFVPFDEVFPFFNWMVAEIDYARMKPTGLTVTVDGGGVPDAPGFEGILSLQEGSPRFIEGEVLTQGVLGFPGQTQVFDWGKKPWAPGENGGISGIVYYASTRGENDPRLTGGEPWEAGLPGVKVRLYKEIEAEDGPVMVLVEETTTDDWDNSLPEGCLGEDPSRPYVTETLGVANVERCYDSWSNWNQAQDAIFDGGYAFGDLEPGRYEVEVVIPPGYELQKEEDVNVAFGDVFSLAAAAAVMPGGGAPAIMPGQEHVERVFTVGWGLVAECVGELREVPGILSMFPTANEPAPFAGEMRPLCDRKEVILSDQSQPAADFFLFTQTPLATQFTGLITDDVAVEDRLTSPNVSEKWSPSYMPVSIRDFEGHELYRGYTDDYGKYNGMAASTFSANLPNASGYSPAMHQVCLNDLGEDAENPDIYRDPDYGTLCYTLQFMPRTTTYLDTPVLPQSAFAAGDNPVDCDQIGGTPEIARVNNVRRQAGQRLTIFSSVDQEVPNPAYEGPHADAPYNESTITRDHGFGTVTGTVSLNGIPLSIAQWRNNRIRADLPAVIPAGEYQLEVVRGDNGLEARNTVTITVGPTRQSVVRPGDSIQAAIDGARPGTLIRVLPGVYNEQVVMWKPVRLQGAGAGLTTINAVRLPTEDLIAWIDRVEGRIRSGDIELLPGQADPFGGDIRALLLSEAAAGVSVFGNRTSFLEAPSRIDGFTITNATGGGGIYVNGWATGLQISNNRVTRNAGILTGGIRVGSPNLPTVGTGPFGFNLGLNIHHNMITRNGGVSEQGGGGGIGLYTGSDFYQITDNMICGNFTTGDGGGIGHLGKSDLGFIGFNDVLFNQSLNGSLTRSGGGLFISGEPVEPDTALTPGAGRVFIEGNRIQGNQAASGHGGGIRTEYINGQDVLNNVFDPNSWNWVIVINNMITNNVAGWSGAGVSLQDTVLSIVSFNTIMNNDSSATVGALFNPVTGESAPQPAGVVSAPHSPALAATMSPFFFQWRDFSNPFFESNIVYHNRSFSYEGLAASGTVLPELSPAYPGDCAAGADYWDLGVLGGAFQLSPESSILTDTTGYSFTNTAADPTVTNEYCNGARELSAGGPMAGYAVFEEGGNIVDVKFGPLTQTWPDDGSANPWDYHIQAGSPAVDYFPPGFSVSVAADFDEELRLGVPDLGADEL